MPIVLLAACDMTVMVTGMLGGSEKLTGSLTHYSDGGTIEIFGGPHTHCVGNFTYSRQENLVSGEGTMVCDDRRMGLFHFALKDMKHGDGWGTLSGQPYRFRF